MLFSAYKKKTDIIEEDKRGTTTCVQNNDEKEGVENIFLVSLKQRVIIVEKNLVAIT